MRRPLGSEFEGRGCWEGHEPEQWVLDEPEVIAAEQRALAERALQEVGGASDGAGFAVAFGGGGVRSAAFCSGVLWALGEENMLRDITHMSAVSGGTVAAASFASFVVGVSKDPQHGPPTSDAEVDSWYRDVVAQMIRDCQKNAGYLLSFEDLKSKTWPAFLWDVVGRPLIMVLVILGVLVVAPGTFAVFYIIPLSILLEAYWGGEMRTIFCNASNPLQLFATGRADWVIWFMGCLALLICALVVFKQALKKEHNLWLRSALHLCNRWFILLAMVIATVILVSTAQEYDYRDLRDGMNITKCSYYTSAARKAKRSESGRGPTLLGKKFRDDSGEDSQLRCADSGMKLIPSPPVTGAYPSLDGAYSTWEGAAAALVEGSPQAFVGLRRPHGNGPSFFIILLLITLTGAVVALVFLALGVRLVWHIFLVVLLPLWFLWPSSFVLQWCTFGPLTGQGLITPFLHAQITGQYSDEAWRTFARCCLGCAILCLPALSIWVYRFVHTYFSLSLRKAFYYRGDDVCMADIAQCRWVPILLIGATLSEFKRPEDQRPNAVFVLTQRAMGCERTRFVPVPGALKLSKCMSLSCAAIDGFVLTKISRWYTRLMLALLNLSQGDWLRFDVGQSWHRLSRDFVRDHPRWTAMIDRVPEMVLWIVIYTSLMCVNSYALATSGEQGACRAFRFWRSFALTVIAGFLGFFSFFPHIRALSWLLASPLVRQFHMFLINATTAREPPMYLYLSDGGPMEDLGLIQLLRRQQRWILSCDCGDDPDCRLLDLRDAIALARSEHICSFFDPADPRRDFEEVLQEYIDSTRTFLHLGVLYSKNNPANLEENDGERVGDIFHTRMRLLCDTPVQGLIQADEVRGPPGGSPAPPRRSPVCRSAAKRHSGRIGHHTNGIATGLPAGSPRQLRMEVTPLAGAEGIAEDGRASPLSAAGGDDLEPAVPELPRSRLAGLCCTCCHAHPACSGTFACMCGAFPNTHTVHQFFTPLMWANFCRLGREMISPAIAALRDAQRRAAASTPAAFTPAAFAASGRGASGVAAAASAAQQRPVPAL